MCGGGGYAVSFEVLQRLFANFSTQQQFYDSYMTFNNLTKFSDITTSHFLTKYAGASLKKLDGLNPWAVTLETISSWRKKGVPILTLHYAAGRMNEYKALVQAKKLDQ